MKLQKKLFKSEYKVVFKKIIVMKSKFELDKDASNNIYEKLYSISLEIFDSMAQFISITRSLFKFYLLVSLTFIQSTLCGIKFQRSQELKQY